MYATPTKADLDRNLSTILHDAHQKARAEKARLTSEFAARGMGSSTALIGAVVGVLDDIHKEVFDRAGPMLRDFAERMEMTPAEITLIARPHLKNIGNSVLGQLPPAGFPAVHQKIRKQYEAVFAQRLEGALRDFEIGFANGRSHIHTSVDPQLGALNRAPVTDAELRYKLLSHFYRLRHSNGGFVPVDDMIITGSEPVTLEAIGNVCRQLGEGGLIEWTGYIGKGRTVGSARITGSGVDAIERESSPSIEIKFPSKNAPAPSSPTISDAPISGAALAEIREVVSTVKSELPALILSNSAKAEITADIDQIEVETQRPTPRRRFMQLYLESLRDNLAKAAGAATAGGAVGLVALVGGILAKHFGMF
jgi:hypothetical protein